MPLPDMAQAEALRLVNYCRADMWAGCGKEPKAHGHLLGHKCRASLGLYDQAQLFEPDEARPCTVCGEPLAKGDHHRKEMHDGCVAEYNRRWKVAAKMGATA